MDAYVESWDDKAQKLVARRAIAFSTEFWNGQRGVTTANGADRTPPLLESSKPYKAPWRA
jgi:hypothetical protein